MTHPRHLALRKLIACLVAGSTGFAALAPGLAWSANNRLSNVVKTTTGSGEVQESLDLTLNTDWDYDAGVTQIGTGANGVAARTLDRAYVEALVRQTARTLFVMTNGRHRIGKVYVFKNGKFGSDVDIRLLNTPGRANASVAGWRAEGGLTTNNYITNKDDKTGVLSAESPEETGEVVAHELGHYVYGLLDEYVERGKACEEPSKQLGSPCQDDSPKPTVMNDQRLSYRLSLPSDYAGQPAYRTAQARGYGGADGSRSSAWEMLVGDPANDSANARAEHNGRRILFDAFKGQAVPTLQQLKQFATAEENASGRFDGQRGTLAADSVFAGYDSQLQLVFEGAGQAAAQPRNVIVVDRTVPQSVFDQIIQAAKGLVDRAPASSRFALVASPATGTPKFFDMDGTGKVQLKSALDQLVRTDGSLDAQAAYAAGKDLVTAARASAGAENAGNTDSFSLYTVNTATVPADLGNTARGDKIAFNVVGFRDPAGTTAAAAQSTAAKAVSKASLAQLAKDSGGSNAVVKSANEAIKQADKALKEAVGESEALIASDLSDDALPAGTSHDVRFKVGPQALDGTVEVRWYFEKADQARLRFSCAPAAGGTPVAVTVQVPVGSDEGIATCSISGARTLGDWIARTEVVAGSGKAAGVETEIVSMPAGGTAVEATATVDGGTLADNRRPLLLVKFAGAFPIVQANVSVAIYNAVTGAAVKQVNLTAANDAGTGGDARAADGIYTLDLTGQLPAGSYEALVTAVTTADSLFNPVQRFALGPAPDAKAVGGEIARQAQVEFALEAGATGVGSTGGGASPSNPPAGSGGTGSGSSSNGGSAGCTVGGGSDTGLLVLLGMAAAALGLRRRRAARQE